VMAALLVYPTLAGSQPNRVRRCPGDAVGGVEPMTLMKVVVWVTFAVRHCGQDSAGIMTP
jgi:hypothetical protein